MTRQFQVRCVKTLSKQSKFGKVTYTFYQENCLYTYCRGKWGGRKKFSLSLSSQSQTNLFSFEKCDISYCWHHLFKYGRGRAIRVKFNLEVLVISKVQLKNIDCTLYCAIKYKQGVAFIIVCTLSWLRSQPKQVSVDSLITKAYISTSLTSYFWTEWPTRPCKTKAILRNC